MGFKPARTNSGGGDNTSYPDPTKVGTVPFRVSLVIDLGIQTLPPFKEEYKPTDPEHIEKLENGSWVESSYMYPKGDGVQCLFTERPDQHQVAIFVDSVSDMIDYGEKIGLKPYRVMVNSSFKGEISGIVFNLNSKNSEGVYTLNSKNMISRIAVAAGVENVANTGEEDFVFENILGAGFMGTLEVKKNEKNGKTYTNVKFSNPTAPPEMPDGSPYPIADLPFEPELITFDDATPEQVKMIRKNVIEQIKKASNYDESHIKTVIEASKSSSSEPESKPEPEKKAPAKAAAKKAKPEPEPADDDLDDDIPF